MSCDLKNFKKYNNGEYFFKKPKNFSIILENFDKIKNNRCILVCFNAAIGDRRNKIGPFYSGRGLANKLGMPAILISDYLVTNNKDLSLAWYAGDENNLDFQCNIANFLDELFLFYKKPLILLGGSGGGFSGLAIASKLKARTFVISINPQTSISKYLSSSVDNYIRHAFLNHNYLTVQNCSEFLDSNNIINNVCDIDYNDNITVLYMQNQSDIFHMINHVSPFIENKDLFPWGDNSFIYKDNVGIFFGNWGVGHKSTPSITLIKLIRLIESDIALCRIMRFLENGADNTITNTVDKIVLTKYDCTINVNAILENNYIETHINIIKRGILVKDINDIYYAIYVLNNKNQVIYRTSYSKTIKKIPYIEGAARVKVFVKDFFGRKLTGLSKNIN